MLLDNLWDEEAGEENHVELWLRFAEGVGVSRENVRNGATSSATRGLVETYRRAAEGSVPGGLAAIYAYEKQIPALARAKVQGLRDHYGVTQDRPLTFWRVHEQLDVEHAGRERAMLAGLVDREPEPTVAATEDALDAWWGFLSEVEMDVAP